MHDVELTLLAILVVAIAIWLKPRPKDPLNAHFISPYYPSCPSDVFKVRRILLEFLPPELVHSILDEAEYWPRIACAAPPDRVGAVYASDYPDNNAALRCLVTPAFPTSQELGGRLRVRRVNFVVTSRDQGWSGEPEHHGASLYYPLANSLLTCARRNVPWVPHMVRSGDSASGAGTSPVGMAKIGLGGGLT
jgi:hypothetical protein